MEATNKELEKINQLQLLLKEYLINHSSVQEPVRHAIAKYSSDQDFLLKFIKGRKMDIKKALRSIIQYAEVRISKYPELFPDEVPHYVLHVTKHGIITVLKNADSFGRTVMLFRASKWDVSKISLEEIICAGRYQIDELMNTPDFLTKGIILVTDCDGASLNHVKQFTVSNIVKFVNVFWQAYPIQIKGLYHVNAPFFVRPVYTVVKPFLPAKLRDRVLITSGVSELYTRIEPGILPGSLGGDLPDEEAVAESPFQLTEEQGGHEEAQSQCALIS